MIHRLIIFSATIVLFSTTARADEQAYQSAYRTAKLTNRPLIIALGADWCRPCHEMEALYTNQFRARGCYVHLNVDRDKALCRQLPNTPAIPALIIYERQHGLWLRPRVIVGLPAIRVWLGR